MSDPVISLPLPPLGKGDDIKVIMVSGTTNSKQLAGSITEEVRQALAQSRTPNVSLHAIGHHAVGQAVKAIPIANGWVAAMGVVLLLLPSFEDKEVTPEGAEKGSPETVTRTVLRLRVVTWRIGG